MWEQIDFLLVPTTETAYSIEQVRADPVQLNTNLGYYTIFANLLDLAAIAIPAAFNSKDFPAGITLLGPAWSDARLAAYADAMQRASDLPLGATGISFPDVKQR